MKLYVSEHNYYPGTTDIKAGSVFSEAQWIASGGTTVGLQEHCARGYIKEAVQTQPSASNVPPADTKKSASNVPPPADKPPADKPAGIWNFTKEELEPFGLPVLNTMLKDRAEEFGLKVEAFKDKPALIEFMTSEA